MAHRAHLDDIGSAPTRSTPTTKGQPWAVQRPRPLGPQRKRRDLQASPKAPSATAAWKPTRLNRPACGAEGCPAVGKRPAPTRDLFAAPTCRPGSPGPWRHLVTALEEDPAECQARTSRRNPPCRRRGTRQRSEFLHPVRTSQGRAGPGWRRSPTYYRCSPRRPREDRATVQGVIGCANRASPVVMRASVWVTPATGDGV